MRPLKLRVRKKDQIHKKRFNAQTILRSSFTAFVSGWEELVRRAGPPFSSKRLVVKENRWLKSSNVPWLKRRARQSRGENPFLMQWSAAIRTRPQTAACPQWAMDSGGESNWQSMQICITRFRNTLSIKSQMDILLTAPLHDLSPFHPPDYRIF